MEEVSLLLGCSLRDERQDMICYGSCWEDWSNDWNEH
jgi:hypothetical protein